MQIRQECLLTFINVCLGSAAQEAIKIISHQFVPFSNTFIYNAMSQTSATLQLWIQLQILSFHRNVREVGKNENEEWKNHLLYRLVLVNPNYTAPAVLKEGGKIGVLSPLNGITT